MARKPPMINASDVGRAAYCPHALSLQKNGHKHNTAAQRKGTQAHESLNRDVLAQDKRCFVATYALGENHPVTARLRLWRDDNLMSSAMGRKLVWLYYQASPLLIRCFGKNQRIRLLSAWIVKRIETRLSRR